MTNHRYHPLFSGLYSYWYQPRLVDYVAIAKRFEAFPEEASIPPTLGAPRIVGEHAMEEIPWEESRWLVGIERKILLTQ